MNKFEKLSNGQLPISVDLEKESKKFQINITEFLSKTVTVEAENFEEACNKVVDMYKNEDVVLTPDDYLETTFEWVEE